MGVRRLARALGHRATGRHHTRKRGASPRPPKMRSPLYIRPRQARTFKTGPRDACFMLNSPRISAKFVSVSRKCPKLRQKCPIFSGHFVRVLFVFIHIPALNVLFLYFCFAVSPAGPSRKH